MVSFQMVKNLQCIAGLARDIQRVKVRFSRSSTRRAVERYLAKNPVGRLHLGAGGSTSAGWLGTDIAPQSHEILRMDATKLFPIPDTSFRYVYCEHMIEHITWHEGAFMLSECHRILRPGGKIRITTPDLSVLFGLYYDKSSPDGEAYIKWVTDKFIDNITLYRPAFVINNAFYNWGHRFLYNKELLEIALRQAGFVDIVSCRQNESSDENLRGIDLHGRNVGNEDMVAFETLVMEARRSP